MRALLGFAGWPVFVIVASVLFSTSFLAVLIVAWRSRAVVLATGDDVQAPPREARALSESPR